MNIKQLLKPNILQKLFQRKIQHVGLDLGTQAIKLVEVVEKEVNKVHPVSTYGMAAMPPDAFDDGVVKQPDPVINALKKLMEDAGVQAKTTVNLGISGKQVIVRQLRMPEMPLDELEQAVRFEAEKYITLPLNQLFLDFTILNEVNVEGVLNYNLLVAAAPKKIIYNLCNTVQKAGLNPVAIDVEPLALYRLWRTYFFNDKLANQAVINIGHSNSHLVVFKGDAIQFTRVIPSAGSQLTEAIIQSVGKEVAAAEEIKHSQKVIHLSQYREGLELNTEESKAHQVVTEVVAGLVSEIQRSIDFYQMQAKARVDKLIITGGTANLSGLNHYLEAELGIPVALGGYGDLDPTYGLASGLAIRDFMKI